MRVSPIEPFRKRSSFELTDKPGGDPAPFSSVLDAIRPVCVAFAVETKKTSAQVMIHFAVLCHSQNPQLLVLLHAQLVISLGIVLHKRDSLERARNDVRGWNGLFR